MDSNLQPNFTVSTRIRIGDVMPVFPPCLSRVSPALILGTDTRRGVNMIICTLTVTSSYTLLTLPVETTWWHYLGALGHLDT